MINKGFIAKGNSKVDAQQVVIGDNARIVNYDSNNQIELLDKIDILIEKLSSANLPAKHRDELLAVAGIAKSEATKEKPDKSKLESSLAVIEKTASSISSVATAIKAVKAVVGLFFGI